MNNFEATSSSLVFFFVPELIRGYYQPAIP